MARVPYTPYPETEPTGATPMRYDIQANPAEFGGLIAQGMEKLGAGQERLGAGLEQANQNLFQGAMQIQDFNNVRDSRNASTSYMNGLGKLYGDYASLQGQAKVDAFPKFQQDVTDLLNNTAQGLKSPMAQNDFLQNAHYMTARTMMGASMEMAQARHQSWATAAQASIEANEQRGVFMMNDAPSVDLAAHQIAGAVRDLGLQNGLTKDDIDAKVSQQLGKYYLKVIEAQVSTNPGLAEQTLQRVRGTMDGDSQAMAERLLHSYTDRSNVAQAVRDFQIGAPPAPAGVINAIVGQEGSGPLAVSSKGAVGRMQVEPATFQQYAEPGEVFGSERDREAVGQRIINAYYQRYDGDVARTAVAYFSGPGNVAPPDSPTPWLTDSNDGRTSVSQYVQGVLSRAGNAASHSPVAPPAEGPGVVQRAPADAFTAEQSVLNQAWATAEQKFPDRPDLQREFVSTIKQQVMEANVLQARNEGQQAKILHDRQEAAGNQVVQSLMNNPQQFDPKTIINNPDLTYQQKIELMGVAQRALGGGDSKDVKTYGPGFYQLFQAVNAPQGDPNRISDVTQLYKHVGPDGDLTMAGLDKLTQFMNGKKTPEGEGTSKMIAGGLAYAKHQLSFEADMGMVKIRDPKGEDAFNTGFLPSFYKAYDAGIAAGKTPYQLLSKDSPDFILDKLVKQFKRSPQDEARDMLQANGPNAPLNAAGMPYTPGAPVPGTNAPAKPDLTTRNGIVAAYHQGQITRQQAAAALVKGGFAMQSEMVPAGAPPPGFHAGPEGGFYPDVVPH